MKKERKEDASKILNWCHKVRMLMKTGEKPKKIAPSLREQNIVKDWMYDAMLVIDEGKEE